MRKLTTLVLTSALALACSLPVLAATPVNVNKADATTIAKSLDGIGMTKARAIVAYRKAHGPFKNASGLAQVKGIGPATLAHNKGDILLQGSSAKTETSDHSKD